MTIAPAPPRTDPHANTDAFLAALGPPGPPVNRSPGALAALENAELAVRYDPVRLWLEREGAAERRRVTKALRLAPSVDIFEGLLRGERVAVSRMIPDWAKAYGLE